MSDITPWQRYLLAATLDEPNTKIAERIGIDATTVGRWKSGEVMPRPRQVVALARAYGLSPLGALVAADFLDKEDVGVDLEMPRLLNLEMFSTVELLEVAIKRVQEAEGYEVREWRGKPTVVRVDERNNVIPITQDVITEKEALELGAVADTGVKEVAEYDVEEDDPV